MIMCNSQGIKEKCSRLFFISAKFTKEKLIDSEIYKIIRLFDLAGDLKTENIRDPSTYLKGILFIFFNFSQYCLFKTIK